MSILHEIAEATRVASESGSEPLESLRARALERAASRRPHAFTAALRTGAGAPRVIAEIKAASPSAGTIVANPDVEAIAASYRAGGAAALSIVAEPRWFRGSIEWIGRAAEASGLPVVMKHFVTEERVLWEGVAAGADAILLIAALLPPDGLRALIGAAESAGRDALVEVHDEQELETAVQAGATLIGVNNRDLRTFSVDLATSERLAGRIPRTATRVAESGIRSPEDAARMRDAGFDAILVGEHLLREGDRAAAVRALLGPPQVKICGITREEDAVAAAEAGASFLGFVFAEGSRRKIAAGAARKIAAVVRSRNDRVRLVGVYRDQSVAFIRDTATEADLDLVQLHGSEPPETIAALDRPVIRAVAMKGGPLAAQEGNPPWLLFDSASGGSGTPFEWSVLRGAQRSGPFFLAGGLTPENVRRAIEETLPDAVDVSTGVESAPGIKDAARMRRFIEEVRRA